MRSIETLVRQYPDKTGEEILKIQIQDQEEDRKEFEKLHFEKLKIIAKINDSDVSYRGSFGLNQYYYYSFSNAKLIYDEIIVDVETILYHDDDSGKEINFQKKFDTYQKLHRYGFESLEEVPREKYERLVDYLKSSLTSFWDTHYLKKQ